MSNHTGSTKIEKLLCKYIFYQPSLSPVGHKDSFSSIYSCHGLYVVSHPMSGLFPSTVLSVYPARMFQASNVSFFQLVSIRALLEICSCFILSKFPSHRTFVHSQYLEQFCKEEWVKTAVTRSKGAKVTKTYLHNFQ